VAAAASPFCLTTTELKLYNYLELTNNVAKRLNEVPLTSINFDSAVGFQADIKSYINQAINRINFDEFEWPFNHVTVNLVLTPEQVKYPYPTDAKTIAFDSFVLKGDDALNVQSQKLKMLDYEEHLEQTLDWELNPADYAQEPKMVFRSRDLTFGIVPPADQAYTVRYEYYSLPIELEAWDDVPTVPEQFKWVIQEGAMYYAYMFRGDLEAASASNAMFLQGLKDMRKIYINRYEYARSTMIGA
jgi:hypothetical protein